MADDRQNALALKTAALATTKSLFQTCSTLRKRLRCVEDFQPFLGKHITPCVADGRPTTRSRTSRRSIPHVSYLPTRIPAMPSIQSTHTHIHRPFFATLCQRPSPQTDRIRFPSVHTFTRRSQELGQTSGKCQNLSKIHRHVLYGNEAKDTGRALAW